MVVINDEIRHAMQMSNSDDTENKHEGYRLLIPLAADLFRIEYARLVREDSPEVEDVTIFDTPRLGPAAVVATRHHVELRGVTYRNYDFIVILDSHVAANNLLFERVEFVRQGEVIRPCDLTALPHDWLRSYYGGICVKGGMVFDREMSEARRKPFPI